LLLATCPIDPLDRRAVLAMTTLPSLQQGFSCERSAAEAKRRSNPAHPSLRGGVADAAIQMPSFNIAFGHLPY